jgi:hypothetical protein
VQRNRRSFGLVILVLLLALGAWWLFGSAAPLPPGISASALTPAPTPADDRMVAVLRLEIKSDAAGEVNEVVMSQGLIQAGYGPNVLNRPGAWTVSLMASADEALRFGLPDPRQVNVETDAGPAPHSGSFQANVDYEVVIPLSDPLGRDLAVTEIRLFDQPGNLIFAAGIRGGKIAPLPNRLPPAGAAG